MGPYGAHHANWNLAEKSFTHRDGWWDRIFDLGWFVSPGKFADAYFLSYKMLKVLKQSNPTIYFVLHYIEKKWHKYALSSTPVKVWNMACCLPGSTCKGCLSRQANFTTWAHTELAKCFVTRSLVWYPYPGCLWLNEASSNWGLKDRTEKLLSTLLTHSGPIWSSPESGASLWCAFDST